MPIPNSESSLKRQGNSAEVTKKSLWQYRKFALPKEICKYPLGPFPWSLSGLNGGLKRTSEVILLHALEKMLKDVEECPSNHVCIVDYTALVLKMRQPGMTFKQVAEKLLKSVLSISKIAVRTDVVFDVYQKGFSMLKECEDRTSSPVKSVESIFINDIKQNCIHQIYWRTMEFRQYRHGDSL